MQSVNPDNSPLEDIVFPLAVTGKTADRTLSFEAEVASKENKPFLADVPVVSATLSCKVIEPYKLP